MLNLTVNQCLLVMAFLVPFVIWLASRPINETIDLADKEHKASEYEELNHVRESYGACIQAQGRYYN